MPSTRHHEQTRACCPTSDPGQQATPARSRPRASRALAVTLLATALAAGPGPALAQPAPAVQPAPAATAAGKERIHQSLAPGTVERAISEAEAQKGKPYAWGGTGPNSFDCSGLVQHAFGKAGVSLPRIAQDQVRSGTRVTYGNAERGDILYWTNGGGYAYHVAIYLGGDRMIDAPRSGRSIAERAVNRYNLAGAVRL